MLLRSLPIVHPKSTLKRQRRYEMFCMAGQKWTANQTDLNCSTTQILLPRLHPSGEKRKVALLFR